LSIPEKLAGAIESVTVYPKILPLFTGQVRISKLTVEGPEVKMQIPEGPQEKEEKSKALSLAEVEDKMAAVLSLVALKVPGLVVEVEKGKLDLVKDNRSLFRFDDIHASIALPPDRVKVEVTSKSNLWEDMSLDGRLDVQNFKGDGHIKVTDFRPQEVTERFLTIDPWRVGESQVNLQFDFEVDGLKAFNADVRGSSPRLTLFRNNEKLVIQGKSVKGSFHMDQEQTVLSLAELDLDHPQLNVAGKLVMTQTAPRVRLELTGRDIDVSSAREAALAVAGDIPQTREILDMVKGGKVPLVSLNTYGASMADLGALENISGKASIVGGEVFVPEYDLNVEDIKVEAALVGGTLEAKSFEARVGNSWAREGRLKLGLEEKNAPFHLDAGIQVDLSELPPLIRRLIEDKRFVKEVDRITDLRGTAVGRVILGERIDSIKAQATVTELNLFANIKSVPYPLEISKGHISYDGKKIAVQNLSGKLKGSHIAGLSAALDLEKEPNVEVTSGNATVSLDEIYPWVASFEGLSKSLKDFKTVKGTLVLSALALKGAALKPEGWRFKTTGKVDNLTVDTTLTPGPIEITRGNFDATEQKLSVESAQVRMLDASLETSGVADKYMQGLHKMEVTLSGRVGPKATHWASSLVDVPPKLHVRSPLSISRAHFSWDKSGKTFLSGNLTVAQGPKVSFDMVQDNEELTVKDLRIEDEKSRASMMFGASEKQLSLKFSGHLTKATLDNFFVDNQLLTGSIEGDLKARINRNKPIESTAEGKLHGTDIHLPLEIGEPLKIESFSIATEKSRLKLQPAIVRWGDRRLVLKGHVNFAAQGIRFDMDLAADGIDGDKLVVLVAEEDKEVTNKQKQDADLWPLPLSGMLRIRSEYLKYETFTWRPLHVDISFEPNKIRAVVTEANLCGVSTPGRVQVSPGDLQVYFGAVSRNEDLDATIACLVGQRAQIDGRFNLEGKVMAQGAPDDLMKSLRGDWEVVAQDGRILRFSALEKVFSFLNVSEILHGQLPDLRSEGLPYNSITAKVNLQGGRLIVEEAVIDGASVQVASHGEVDLINKKLDFEVLVAPLKTVDDVVKKIPLLGNILGGTLVNIPVRVHGDLSDPKVVPLSPSAMGSRLKGIMERTLKLPIEVIQPIVPHGKENPAAP
jgi:hypothetical protein